MRNDFLGKWSGYGREPEGVCADEIGTIGDALEIDDGEPANLILGKAIGAVHDIPTAGDLIDRIVAEASERLMRFAPTPGAKQAAYAGA
jgi:nitronate monooxygenase